MTKNEVRSSKSGRKSTFLQDDQAARPVRSPTPAKLRQVPPAARIYDDPGEENWL